MVGIVILGHVSKHLKIGKFHINPKCPSFLQKMRSSGSVRAISAHGSSWPELRGVALVYRSPHHSLLHCTLFFHLGMCLATEGFEFENLGLTCQFEGNPICAERNLWAGGDGHSSCWGNAGT